MTPLIGEGCSNCHQGVEFQDEISKSDRLICNQCRKITQNHNDGGASLGARAIERADPLFDAGLILDLIYRVLANMFPLISR